MTLIERIDAALDRIARGHAPMRVPAEVTDVDIVLSACRAQLAAQSKEMDSLVDFFRHEGFFAFGNDGDHNNWPPVRTAIEAMRECMTLRAENKELQSAMPQPCCQEYATCIRTCVPRLKRQNQEQSKEMDSLREQHVKIVADYFAEWRASGHKDLRSASHELQAAIRAIDAAKEQDKAI